MVRHAPLYLPGWGWYPRGPCAASGVQPRSRCPSDDCVSSAFKRPADVAAVIAANEKRDKSAFINPHIGIGPLFACWQRAPASLVGDVLCSVDSRAAMDGFGHCGDGEVNSWGGFHFGTMELCGGIQRSWWDFGN